MESGIKNTYLMSGSALLLLISLVFNGVFISRNNSLENERNKAILLSDSMQAVKQLLNKEYDEAKASLEKYKGHNTELDNTIAALNVQLNDQKEQINKLAKDNASVVALRKQLAEMKKLRKECDEQMSRIMLENDKYVLRVQEMSNMNSSLQSELKQLQDKLEAAKELKAYNFHVVNYKLKNSKAVPTTRARKTERIAVTFDLVENYVADAGSKNIYAIITAPGGEVLIMHNNKFYNKREGKEIPYSALKEVEFNNKEQRVTINFDYDNKLKGGKYKAELYTDGAYTGKTEFYLR